MSNKESYKNLMLATAIGETVLAIPIISGIFIISTMYIPLLVMLVLHILVIVMWNKLGKSTSVWSVLGIITSVLGWIPFVGWALHVITAILLWVRINND